METNDTSKFFLSDAAHANNARKAAKAGNKNGNPLVMKSKILAVILDPADPCNGVFIAESAGFVRRINVTSAETKMTYRGPKAPVTCVALGGRDQQTVFAGSWDKDVWSWNVGSGKLGQKFVGHSDFIKTVVCGRIAGKEILVSGGADKKIMVWDIETGRRLHTLQDATTMMLAVQDLVIDPILSTSDSMVIVSASSDPYIRRWKISLEAAEQLAESFHDRPETERLTIEEHRTSVYSLWFEDEDSECNLWSTDADGLAKCLDRSRNFVTQDVYEHGDYLRAVLATDSWVVTAGRDENVKVWDRASGKLYCTLEGHFEEVTGLAMLWNSQGRRDKVISVSIDGTIRTWRLMKTELDEVIKKMEKSTWKEEDVNDDAGNLLTAEEEAELAELMADDD